MIESIVITGVKSNFIGSHAEYLLRRTSNLTTITA